jgi:glycosyltransferase involved in cell wall biosynthesis
MSDPGGESKAGTPHDRTAPRGRERSVYLLVTHIPIWMSGGRGHLDDAWFRDVLLAREWLAEPFGDRLVLIAPWRPLTPEVGPVHPVEDAGIEAVPAVDGRCRARTFWLTERTRWTAAVNRHLPEAQVLHTAMGDLFRPMQQLAFAAAHRAGVPTVLVGPDMDPHQVYREQLEGGSLASTARLRLYLAAFEGVLRRQLRQADLALLKEGTVHERYAQYAAHPRAFCHTMYRAGDVVREASVAQRLETLATGRPMRAVYCGRWVARKGLHVALEVIARARGRGAQVELDLIGGGPEERALRQRAADLRIGGAVRFLGPLPYGPELIARLAEYDLLLYTPVEEDTPRMVYDGYAAGLPLVGARIPFVQHRAETDFAAVTFPVGDADAGAEVLLALDRDRGLLREISRRARSAGLHHATDNWYRRRREWTLEAVARSRGQAAPA